MLKLYPSDVSRAKYCNNSMQYKKYSYDGRCLFEISQLFIYLFIYVCLSSLITPSVPYYMFCARLCMFKHVCTKKIKLWMKKRISDSHQSCHILDLICSKPLGFDLLKYFQSIFSAIILCHQCLIVATLPVIKQNKGRSSFGRELSCNGLFFITPAPLESINRNSSSSRSGWQKWLLNNWIPVISVCIKSRTMYQPSLKISLSSR